MWFFIVTIKKQEDSNLTLSSIRRWLKFFDGLSHLLLFNCFRPSLPPAKQANRNLILKAISEAQDSITKTTAFPRSMFYQKFYHV